MKLRFILIAFTLALSSCSMYDNSGIDKENVKKNKLLIPPNITK
jgi:F420-0:gamma-glutamyl ligase